MQAISDTADGTKPGKTSRKEHLSPDGKWKSFPKVPHLLQYVGTGNYFARVKVNGKLIRQKLRPETTVYSDALVRLPDFLKKQRKSKRHVKGAPVYFRDARTLYETDLDNDHTVADSHRNFRKWSVKSLLKNWSGLDDLKLAAIKKESCREWAKRLSEKVGPQYFNNVLGTFRAIFKRAGYQPEDNPLHEIKRLGIPLAPPQLPESDQFNQLLEIMENGGAKHSKNCADLGSFLAYSGCRLGEARMVKWLDVDMFKGYITVHNLKTRRTKNYRPTRQVPIIADMRRLLERLKQSNPRPEDPVCKVSECEKSLARACERIRIPKLTHHDLRHLFTTRCIESGVDIPTVSRWLGHSDGGALVMKVYGHLRDKHSLHMAAKVVFNQPNPKAIP